MALPTNRGVHKTDGMKAALEVIELSDVGMLAKQSGPHFRVERYEDH
jgi:hypothetical protein